MLRILILDDYQDFALASADWHVLAEVQIDIQRETLADDTQRMACFAAYDVIVAMRERTPFSAALLAGLPRLRLLVTTGMRNASIDMQACATQGITVCGAPGSQASANATVEVAWALILGLLKRIPSGQRAMLDGHWQPVTTESLTGKTLGVAGLGKLGTGMARAGQAFGMRVQAWSPNLTAARAEAALPGVAAVDKHTLFSTSDIVSLHLILGDSTAGVVGPGDFAAMRPSAYFINTARAALVAPGALLAALQAGHLAGAGLDVFDNEPVPSGDPLANMPNVLASPHVGYVTDDNLRAYYVNAVRAIAAWQAGAPRRVLQAH